MAARLQRLVFPKLAAGLATASCEELYVRLNDSAWPDLTHGSVHFETGGTLSTDTFYNGVSVGAWQRRCHIEAPTIRLEGEGEFVARIGLHRSGQSSVWLAEHRVVIACGVPIELPIADWPALDGGMLFVRLRALGPALLTGGGFCSAAAPAQAVRLGIVITHFNRQQQVMGAIERIRTELLDDPELHGAITLTVVDNSSNLTLAPHPAITHLPNRNLGGTGGFVRGLLALIDGGACTHVLFMDDDASCETESIARTLALLRAAKDPKLAIAGSLLREAAPWELIEKGARFDGQVVPLQAGLDMRHVPQLLEAERASARPEYGAWWFFAFPVEEVRHFPFPFFVRGDDIQFGQANRFEIATLNGIGCLGEDFGSKHGPMTAYLDARYHLVLALLAPGAWRGRVAWVARRLFLKSLTSYLYASAQAVTLAIDDVAQGPEFFRANLDMQQVRARIAGFAAAEKLVPIDRAALAVRPARRRGETVWRRLARIVTLQGFLLPDFLLKSRMTVQRKGFHGNAGAVFRYRRVLYEQPQTETGFIAEFDRARFFGELRRFIVTWSRFAASLPALRRAYAEGAPALASEAFWREVYGDSSPVEARAEAGAAGRAEVVGATVPAETTGG